MSAAEPIECIDTDPIETTLIELVLSACEWSEDQGEIADLVDSMVDDGVVRLTAFAPEPEAAIVWPRGSPRASERPPSLL